MTTKRAKSKGIIRGPVFKLKLPNFKKMGEIFRKKIKLLKTLDPNSDDPIFNNFREEEDESFYENTMNRDKPVEPEIRRSRTKTTIRCRNQTLEIEKPILENPSYKDALMQGKKHADNPWIQAVTLKEERVAYRFSRKLVTLKKKLNEGIHRLRETDREADIIAIELGEEIIKVGDKQDYHQLIKYDTWENDFTPKVWIEKCQESNKEAHGISPVYDGQVYIWEAVKIIGYSEKLKKFQVVVLSTGQMKFVSRLSLMFYDEDRGMFRERLKQCRERREGVENELRFQNYVDLLPLSSTIHIPSRTLDNIIAKAALKEINMDKKHINTVVARLTKVIDALYRRAIRKCLVLEKSVILDEMYKLDAVNVPVKLMGRILSREAVIKVGWTTKRHRGIEMSQGEDSSAEDKRSPVKGLNQDRRFGALSEMRNKRRERKTEFIRSFEKDLLRYTNSTKLVNSFTDEFQKTCEHFKRRRLLQTNTQRLQLPMKCSDFMAVQDKKLRATITDILNNWRFQILYSMRDKVGKKFAFDVADRKKYEESSIRKLIHKYDLMFHNHLQEFYKFSIQDFVEFMRSFTQIKDNSVWKISPIPLIEIDISITGLEKKEEKKESKKDGKTENEKVKKKKDKKREKAIKIPKNLVFVPDIDNCKNEILSLFDQISKSTQKISILETEDFNVFLTEKKALACNLTLETPLIANAHSAVSAYIDDSMIGPKQLLASFKKYEYLIHTNVNDIKKIIDKDKTPTATELKEHLDNLAKARYEIRTLATNSVRFSMFQVNTTVVKDYLAERATKLKQALQQAISKHCQRSVIEILENYRKILTKLEDKPTSKEGYKELKMYLKNSNKRMDELKAQHELIRLKLELLEDNLMEANKDDEHNFLDVHQYPSKLRSKIAKGNSNLINYEEQIRIELENRKDQFDRDMNEHQSLFVEVIKFEDIESARKVYRSAFELHDKLDKAIIKAKEINDDEALLEMKKTEYNGLEKLIRDFKPFYSLIKLAEEIQMNIEGWKTNPFIGLNSFEIESDIKTWNITLDDLNKQLNDYKDHADVALQLKEFVEQFTQHTDIIKCLRSEAMKEEDFNEINKETPLNIKIDDEIYTLNALINKNANDYLPQIRKIWERAEKKLDLEKNLKRIKDDMHKKRIELLKYGNTENYIIQNYKQLMDHVDDHMAVLQGMLESQYMVGALKKNCIAWGAKLGLILEILEELKKCQQIWIHLEPIFSAEDIRLTLKLETEQFININSKLIQEMAIINADNLVVSLLDKERLKEDFVRANSDLESIVKSLADFFESKRKKFPRFYFISDDDLIKLISHSKQDPSCVEPYLSKCFNQMNSLTFEQNNQQVTSIVATSGEKIKLFRPLDIHEGDKRGNVELWLKELEEVMFETMKLLAVRGIKDYITKPLNEYIFSWPSQIVLIANQIHFCTEVTSALQNYKRRIVSLEELANRLQTRIQEYVKVTRGDISPLNCLIIEALIIIDVYQKSIIKDLIDKNVESEASFDWLIHMRYSFVDDLIRMNILNSSLPYGYECDGNPSRIVISPLTDRCFRTLVMAKQINRGGAVIGPEGSGKTETIKTLAKIMGVYCVVFDGSDEIDNLSLTKFFKGLASSGAWCCFKEFNKIPLGVLSILASQISSIQQALNLNETLFRFMNEEIILNPQCGINITFNNSSVLKDDSPDSLKQLFRLCAITIPDNTLIAEVLLYSYGFQDPKAMSRKLVGMFKLCQEQLSDSGHHTFGIRVLKTAIYKAKMLRKTFTNETEEGIIKRVLDELNLPKLTGNDTILYKDIVSDIFTNASIETEIQDANKFIISTFEKLKLQPKPEFVTKCLQLYESLTISSGTIVTGKFLSGKTTAIQIVSKALSSENDEVRLQVLNPKAVTLKQLFGYFDDSHMWIDGVLSRVLKDFVESDESCKKWLVCDGPMDSEWMESVSSMLDDNRKLCLGSGTAINLNKTIQTIFEAEGLKHASPGIISRCSVVYMESTTLDWEIVLKQYCEELPVVLTTKRIKIVEELIRSIVIPCIVFIEKHCKYPIEMNMIHLVNNVVNIFECFMTDMRKAEYKLSSDIDNVIQNILIFSIMWGFGGALEELTRNKFRDFLIDLLNMADINAKYKLEVVFTPAKFNTKFLENHDPFKLMYDHNKNQWRPWITSDLLSSLPNDTPFHNLIISTYESERTNSLIYLLTTNRKHIMLLGPSSSGKSTTIYHGLKTNFSNAKYTNIIVPLSTQTTANQVQYTIECKLEKCGRKACYGPLHAKQGVIFVDDLNIPQKDTYEAQPSIELLRQWMDYGGWYDIDTVERKFKYITNVAFIGAITTSKPKDINLRYLRHFNTIYIESYDNKLFIKIFTEILSWKFKDVHTNEILTLIPTIIEALMELYNSLQMSVKLRPVPSKTHYAYNIRDVGKVIQGLFLANPLVVVSQEDLIKLWAHESTRIFHDRLATQNDRNAFAVILKNTLKTHFDKDWESPSNIIFCDFVSLSTEDSKVQLYSEILDRNVLKSTTEGFLAKYNESNKLKLNIILFEGAVEFIAQIKRILSLPLGHVLLLGLGSSGRKSLASLATFICGFELFPITSNYNVNEWHDKLRKLMTLTGVEQLPTVLLLGDNQVNDYVLEDLHNLLTKGEIPNLFFKSEKNTKEDHIGKLKESLQSRYKKVFNYDEEVLEILKKYSNKMLHIACYISPVNKKLRDYIRMYPSLMNNMTLNYFLPWPNEGFQSVALQLLSDLQGLDSQKDTVISTFVEMKENVKSLAEKYESDGCGHYYVTPSNYMEMLKIFKTIFKEKSSATLNGINTYENGLGELRRTEQFVTEMKAKLQAMEPELRQKTESATQLADSLRRKQTEITEETKIVKKEQEKAEEMKKIADELQAECQCELNIVLPELKEAEKLIGGIKQDAIASLAAMGSPPEEVKLVAKALCVILDIKPKKLPKSTELDYWMPKKIFTFKSIKWCTVDFDKENIPMAKITELLKINDDPSFSSEKLKSVSAPGEMLARWIRAVIRFDQVNREVAPKKKKLNEETEKAKKANDNWAEKNKQLEEKREILKELNKGAKEAEEQKRRLMQDIEVTRKKIERARELVDLLKNEHKRWNDQKNILQEWHKNITGDIIISSGVIAYLGIFPILYREMCINQWSSILKRYSIGMTENYSLFNILGDPLRKPVYSRIRFPADTISTENMIIMERSTRWAIMIDPQSQALEWLKTKPGLVEINAAKDIDSVLKQLTLCMTSGAPTLLEELPEIVDSRLNPLLKKDFLIKGSQRLIQFNGENINAGKDFTLYILTKAASPHYSPEVCSSVVMLNFAITKEGLMEQCLNIIVTKEDPITERNRDDIVYKGLETKKKLKLKEEELLKTVTTYREGILESDRLLDTLKTTKSECQHFIIQVEEQKRVSEKIEAIRTKFKAVAVHVASLYFCVVDLAMVNSVYQFSLDWYLDLYHKALEIKCADEEKDKVDFYKHHFMDLLFTSLCRSIFEKDKLLLGLNVHLKIALSEGSNTMEEAQFLAKGFTVTNESVINPLSQWMSDKAWKNLHELSQRFDTFKNLNSELMKDVEKWKKLYNSPDLLNPLLDAYNPLQRLLVCIALQPNKFIELSKQLVTITLSKQFFDYRYNSLDETFAASVNNKPIFIISSPGINPVEEIKALAARRNLNFDIVTISLGQSQEKAIKLAIEHLTGVKTGGWVILQNCHLATSCLNSIEEIVNEIPRETKKEFRLWLTTLPSKDLPVSLLQKSLKLVSERPKGITRNLSNSINAIRSDIFTESGEDADVGKKIIFSLCLFHAVIVERQKYGVLAWNMFYDFSQTELLITIKQILPLLKEGPNVPWDALKYLITEANYGGQINDSMDMRLIKSLLSDFIEPDILKDNYKFCGAEKYLMPKSMKSRDECLRFIKNFPQNDNPEIVGLSEAAVIAYSIKDGLEIQSMLMKILGSDKSPSDSRQEFIEKAKSLLNELPKELDIEKCVKNYPIDYAESLNSFLQQEVNKFNKLINVVCEQLQDLEKVLRGDILLSRELEEVCYGIHTNTIPGFWQRQAYLSFKPLHSWITDLNTRTQFLNNWINEGYPNEYLLGIFFRPQSFISALRQNYSRKTKVHFDDVIFEHKVVDKCAKSDTEKYLSGMYIEGAMWNSSKKCIGELEIGSSIITMPSILFTPIELSKHKLSKVFCLL